MRANFLSSALNNFRSNGWGLLTQKAINGDRIQMMKSTPITGSAVGLKPKVRPSATSVNTEEGSINFTHAGRSLRVDFSVSAADTHSSRFFRETICRYNARMIASHMSHV